MCRFCGKPCGEREFCDEVCFEAHAEAMEEWQKTATDEDDGPQNEWCGSKGNNI